MFNISRKAILQVTCQQKKSGGRKVWSNRTLTYCCTCLVLIKSIEVPVLGWILLARAGNRWTTLLISVFHRKLVAPWLKQLLSAFRWEKSILNHLLTVFIHTTCVCHFIGYIWTVIHLTVCVLCHISPHNVLSIQSGLLVYGQTECRAARMTISIYASIITKTKTSNIFASEVKLRPNWDHPPPPV